MNKLVTKYIPRAGLFAMIISAAVVPPFIGGFTTEAFVAIALAAAVTAFIIKDRWFS